MRTWMTDKLKRVISSGKEKRQGEKCEGRSKRVVSGSRELYGLWQGGEGEAG